MNFKNELPEEPINESPLADVTSSISDESDLAVVPINPINKHNLDYHPDDYQKRGFHAAILEKQNHHTLLADLLKVIETQRERIMGEVNELFELRKKHHIDRIIILEKRIEEIQAKKELYEVLLTEIGVERGEVKVELIGLQEQLETTLKNVGLAKHQLVGKRISQIQSELDALITIHHQAEDKQNIRFTDKNKHLNQERINFLIALKKDYQQSFDAVNIRIKGFDKTGISLVLANTLISIGFLGTLIAGWLFSLWTGPKPTQNDQGNIVSNNSVLFFLLKELSRFTIRYSRTELIIGILIFFGLMFAVSWACYKMLVYFGFIANPTTEQNQTKHETEFELDFTNQDDFFKSQIKGNNWFSFWLKLTPLLLFVFILLVVLGRVSIQPEDEFQKMFDSLVNQNFGSMLCILISGLIYLYVIKNIEPRYISISESGEYLQKETAINSWELLTTFALFVLLLIVFLTSYSWLSLFIDTRKLFLIAFFITTVSTGFCISYGLRYRELIGNYDLLERHLYKLTELIYRISKPISYLENQRFQDRISDLQAKILQMIEKRNALALFLIDNNEDIKNESSVNSFDNILFAPVKAGHRLMLLIWQSSLPIRQWLSALLRRKIDKIINKDELFSDEDKMYFPELVAEVDELQKRINTRMKRLTDFDQQKDDYWREQGLYRSIQQQLAKRRKVIAELKKRIEEDTLEQYNELNRIDTITHKQKDLLIEGFNTGLWYLKHGDDLRDMYLIS